MAAWLHEATPGGRGAEIHVGVEELAVCAVTDTGSGQRRYCPEAMPASAHVLHVRESAGLARVGIGMHETPSGDLEWYVRNGAAQDLEEVRLELVLPDGSLLDVGSLHRLAGHSTVSLPFQEEAYEGPATLTLTAGNDVVQEIEGFFVAEIGWIR